MLTYNLYMMKWTDYVFLFQRNITVENYKETIEDLNNTVNNINNPDDQSAENLAVISRILSDTAALRLIMIEDPEDNNIDVDEDVCIVCTSCLVGMLLL